MLVDKFLYGQVDNPHKLKELKVKIPLHYHMRLHGLKILGEDSISASVGKVLELYFQKLGTAVAPAGSTRHDGGFASAGAPVDAANAATNAATTATADAAQGAAGVASGAAPSSVDSL